MGTGREDRCQCLSFPNKGNDINLTDRPQIRMKPRIKSVARFSHSFQIVIDKEQRRTTRRQLYSAKTIR